MLKSVLGESYSELLWKVKKIENEKDYLEMHKRLSECLQTLKADNDKVDEEQVCTTLEMGEAFKVARGVVVQSVVEKFFQDLEILDAGGETVDSFSASMESVGVGGFSVTGIKAFIQGLNESNSVFTAIKKGVTIVGLNSCCLLATSFLVSALLFILIIFREINGYALIINQTKMDLYWNEADIISGTIEVNPEPVKGIYTSAPTITFFHQKAKVGFYGAETINTFMASTVVSVYDPQQDDYVKKTENKGFVHVYFNVPYTGKALGSMIISQNKKSSLNELKGLSTDYFKEVIEGGYTVASSLYSSGTATKLGYGIFYLDTI